MLIYVLFVSDRLISMHLDTPAPVVPEGTPIFLQEPEPNYYIVKGKPVTIMCRASPAVVINIKCRGVWYASKNHVNEERIDPTTGKKYLQTSIEVTQAAVEEYFGEEGYNCECQAINMLPGTGRLTAVSRKGLVEEACEYSDFLTLIVFLCILFM